MTFFQDSIALAYAQIRHWKGSKCQDKCVTSLSQSWGKWVGRSARAGFKLLETVSLNSKLNFDHSWLANKDREVFTCDAIIDLYLGSRWVVVKGALGGKLRLPRQSWLVGYFSLTKQSHSLSNSLPTFQLQSMLSLLYILLSPILLFISVPLSLFAALTTTLAFSTLFFRALLVYAELGAVLIQNQFVSQHGNERNPITTKVPPTVVEAKQPRHKSRRNSAGSGSNGGSITPRLPDAGFGVYSSGGGVRDFEGVGGWYVKSEPISPTHMSFKTCFERIYSLALFQGSLLTP